MGPAEPNLDHILKPGMPIPRYNNLRMGLPAKSSLLRLWREKRPDVVHLVTEGPLGWSSLSAALKLKIPVTSDFHTNFHHYSRHYGLGWLKTPIESYLRKFHNRTRLTLVPTHAMREELLQDGYRNLKVVARGVDTQRFTPARRSNCLRAAWGVRPDDLVALYVGRLAAEKICRWCCALCRDARAPTERQAGAGGGWSIARRTGSNLPRHDFRRHAHGPGSRHLLRLGRCVSLPSLTETFGNVTLEAMASGLAVIAYDYAAARELIAHRENGLLAPFDAADTFAPWRARSRRSREPYAHSAQPRAPNRGRHELVHDLFPIRTSTVRCGENERKGTVMQPPMNSVLARLNAADTALCVRINRINHALAPCSACLAQSAAWATAHSGTP